jgi:uncharacterized protein (TIGR02646 family)
MIRFSKPTKPTKFDERVLVRGLHKLAEFRKKERTTSEPTPEEWETFWKSFGYWTEFSADLDDGFNGLCAYTALSTNGANEVDHFKAKSENPDSAYEWNNYRNTTGSTNKKKNRSNKPILDPFEIEDDWFEVNLFTGEISVSTQVPADMKERAENSIKVLGLDSSRNEKARKRLALVPLKKKNHHNEGVLECIEQASPLVARAVQKYWLRLATKEEETEESARDRFQS